MERGCTSSRVPGTPTQLSASPWVCPPVGLATAWWHPKAGTRHLWELEGQEFGPMSPTLNHWAWGRDTAALAGHRILWAPAHPKSRRLPPHSSCVVSRGVAGHTVAVVAAVVAASQLPIPSRPCCQLQLPHYYSARSLPKQPAPLWWEQPEGCGSASGAGHRRPPTAPRCPAGTGALCSTVTRAQTPTGPVVPPWVTKPVPSPPRGCSWHTRGSSTWATEHPCPCALATLPCSRAPPRAPVCP